MTGPEIKPRSRLRNARVGVLVAVVAAAAFVHILAAYAQTPTARPPGATGGDPWLDDENLDRPADRRPSTHVQVVTSQDVYNRRLFIGRILRITDGEHTHHLRGGGIDRVPFEDDPNFEARTYRYDELQRLLGTISNAAVLHMRLVDGPSATYAIPYSAVDSIKYPATWLDIFAEEMAAVAELEIDAQLAAVDDFRWRHAGEIAEDFSPRLRAAFHDALLDAYAVMRTRAPHNAGVVLALGDLLAELGRFDEELEAYIAARNRGLVDPSGELAYRLGRLYLHVLNLPDDAVEELAAVPFPPVSTTGMNAAVLRLEALLAARRYDEVAKHGYDLQTTLLRLSLEDGIETADGVWRPSFGDREDWSATVSRVLGEAAMRQGRLYEAARHLRQVPAGARDSERVQILLATCYLNMGMNIRTGSERSSVLPSVNVRGLPRISQAVAAAMRISDNDVARIVANSAYDPFAPGEPVVAFDPALARALCLLARAELEEGTQRALAEATRDRVREARRTGRMEPLLARSINPQARITVAKYAIQAMRHDPTSEEPLLILAEYAMRPAPNVDADEANALRAHAFGWLERAGRLDPTNPMPHYQGAFYRARMRHFPEAIAELRTTLRLAPDFVDAHVLLGELYYRLAQHAARTGEGNSRDWLRQAIAYFSSALNIDRERVGVRLKLGHCFLERAHMNYDVARRQLAEFRLGRVDRGAVQIAWNTVAGDLRQAAEHLAVEPLLRPRVLEIISRVGEVPRVVIDAGSAAGVVNGMTFRADGAGAAALSLRVVEAPLPSVAVCEPLAYDTDPAVPRAMQRLAVGDPVTLPARAPGGTGRAAEQEPLLHREAVLISRSAMGYVLYMQDYIRDYIDDRGGGLDGREYEPGPELAQAEALLRWVIGWVEASDQAEALSVHPAYTYAKQAFAVLQDRRSRVQWVDDFHRELAGTDRRIIGQGWDINRHRDLGLTFATSMQDSTLRVFTTDEPAQGSWTRITRDEANLERFHAIAVDLLVDPDTGLPSGLDGEVGLLIQLGSQAADEGGEATGTELAVTLDTQGQVRMRYRHQRSDDERVIALTRTGPQTASRLRSLRLLREVVPARQGTRAHVQYRVVLGDSHEAVLPVPAGPMTVPNPGGDARLSVGLILRPRVGSRQFDVRFDAVRVIRERTRRSD